MMSFLTDAKQILKDGKAAKYQNSKANAICKPVADALIAFCEQSEEFAQAIVQGKPFNECVVTVADSLGAAVSDFEVYSRAVEFYFPGAKIEFQMKIKMSAFEKDDSAAAGVVFDITDFMP